MTQVPQQEQRRPAGVSVSVTSTPDHQLIVLCMALIFVLMMSGIVAVIIAESADKTLIISLVALGSQALGRFAAVPAFPAMVQLDPQVAATAAAGILKTAETAANKQAAGAPGTLKSGDEVKVEVPGADPLTPVATGDTVIVTKGEPPKT